MKFLVVISLLFFLVTGCDNEKDVVNMDSGLQYVVDTTGTGREAERGDLVTIHFKGWVIPDTVSADFEDWSSDSSKMRQSIGNSKLSGKPIKFVLGAENFIKGTDDAIVGMKAGGTRTMIIPSELAYGKEGIGPIPPNSDLKVEVNLIDVKDRIEAKMWDVDTTSIKTTKSGLNYVIVEEGPGETPDSGDIVSVHYSGWLKDSTKFDSSIERDEPITFTIGRRMVIPGWDEGIKLLKEGGKGRFIIPPDLAYGSRSVGKIPANSTLIFDIELVEIR